MPATNPEMVNAVSFDRHRRHRERLRGQFVLAHRDDRPPGAAVADTSQREVDEGEDDERVHVEAGRRRHVDAAEQREPFDALLGHPVEELAVEQPRVDREERTRAWSPRGTSPRSRSAGSPTTSAAAAPAAPPSSSASDMSTFQLIVHLPLTAAPIADERHLAERDLSGPAREHHQRQPDDGEHDDGSRLDDLVGAQQQGDQREPDQDRSRRAPAQQPHQRESGDPGLERPDLVGESPGCGLVAIGSAVLAALQQQRERALPHRRSA